MGGWIPVLPTRDGHYYSVITSLPTTRLVSRFSEEQHHLCRITLSSYMPERLFSHSLDKPVSLSEADTQNRTENWRLETSDFTTKLHPQCDPPKHTGLTVNVIREYSDNNSRQMVVGEGFEPSKLSQRIYSPSPLTAREPHHSCLSRYA